MPRAERRPLTRLFLSLSFFVILAAVMLIAMLFRLGLIQRMTQFGTLMAVGWTPRRVTQVDAGRRAVDCRRRRRAWA